LEEETNAMTTPENDSSSSPVLSESQMHETHGESRVIPDIIATEPDPTDDKDLQMHEELELEKDENTHLFVPGVQKGFFKKNIEDGMDK